MRSDKLDLKTPEQIRAMRRVGLVVADALAAVQSAAVPGVTGRELDAVAEQVIRNAGARPNFLGYHGYPASICLSIDQVVVHGIPSAQVLHPGQVVSVDCGAELGGWHGDAAITFGVGEIDAAAVTLIEATAASLWAGIAAMARGSFVRDIGIAVEAEVHGRDSSLGVLEDYVGHGIGRAMHTDPDVPNFPVRGRSPRLRPGATLAIEPMVVEGDIETSIDDDGWTVRTVDGGRSAHWEHTVALTDSGITVLTAHDAGAAGLAAHGLTPVSISASI